MKHKIPTEFIFAAISVAGGVAKYLSHYLAGGKFHWNLLFANMFLSGFSGVMFAFFARSVGINGDMVFVFSGVGGFMSSSGLEFLIKRLKSKV